MASNVEYIHTVVAASYWGIVLTLRKTKDSIECSNTDICEYCREARLVYLLLLQIREDGEDCGQEPG
jgi:hypothetical protein